MDIEIKTLSIPQTAGQWDITITGFGTPDAVIAYSGGGSVSPSHWRASFGVYDGSSQYCVAGGVEAGVTSGTRETRIEARSKLITNTFGWQYHAVVSATQFITDGVQLNIETAPNNASKECYVTFIFLKGVAAEAGILTPSGSADGSVTETLGTTSLTPDLIAGCLAYNSLDNPYTRGLASMGWAAKVGAQIEQRVAAQYFRNGTTSQLTSYCGKNKGLAARLAETSVLGYLDITDMSQGSFDVTSRDRGMADSPLVYLAIDLGDADVGFHDVVMPTAAGDWDPFTATSEPKFVHMGMISSTDYDTLKTGGQVVSQYFACNNGAGLAQAYHASRAQDAVSDPTAVVARGEYSASQCEVIDDDGTVLASFGSPSFDGSGILITDANIAHGGSAYKGWALSVGAATAPTLTSVEDTEGDQSYYEGQGDITLTGTNFKVT